MDTKTLTHDTRAGGRFKGQPIAADEWVTDVYRKIA